MEFQQLIKEEILPYDTDRYPLKDVIAKILECEDRPLQELHETIPGSEDAAILTLAHDQCLVFHRMYYQSPLMYKVRARDPQPTHTPAIAALVAVGCTTALPPLCCASQATLSLSTWWCECSPTGRTHRCV